MAQKKYEIQFLQIRDMDPETGQAADPQNPWEIHSVYPNLIVKINRKGEPKDHYDYDTIPLAEWEAKGNTLHTLKPSCVWLYTRGKSKYLINWILKKTGKAKGIVPLTIREEQKLLKADYELNKKIPNDEAHINTHEPHQLTSWTCVNDTQFDMLAEFVDGKTVVDLCGGSGRMAEHCCALGAKKVIVVDLEFTPEQRETERYGTDNENIIRLKADLREGLPLNLPKGYLLLASPPPDSHQYPIQPKWAEIIDHFDHILYIGGNQRGHICGSVKMWEKLIHREITTAKAIHDSAVIIYGPKPRKSLQILKEEAIGLIGLKLGEKKDTASLCIPKSSAKWLLGRQNKKETV